MLGGQEGAEEDGGEEHRDVVQSEQHRPVGVGQVPPVVRRVAVLQPRGRKNARDVLGAEATRAVQRRHQRSEGGQLGQVQLVPRPQT